MENDEKNREYGSTANEYSKAEESKSFQGNAEASEQKSVPEVQTGGSDSARV